MGSFLMYDRVDRVRAFANKTNEVPGVPRLQTRLQPTLWSKAKVFSYMKSKFGLRLQTKVFGLSGLAKSECAVPRGAQTTNAPTNSETESIDECIHEE
jgi:hypothetical protein